MQGSDTRFLDLRYFGGTTQKIRATENRKIECLTPGVIIIATHATAPSRAFRIYAALHEEFSSNTYQSTPGFGLDNLEVTIIIASLFRRFSRSLAKAPYIWLLNVNSFVCVPVEGLGRQEWIYESLVLIHETRGWSFAHQKIKPHLMA